MLEVCVGENVVYQGVEIVFGEMCEFIFLSVVGCDSMVMVIVMSYLSLDFELEIMVSCVGLGMGMVCFINILGVV